MPLLRASHLQPCIAVTAITVALALAVERGATAWWVGLAVLCGQLSVGWSNDYVDRDRDRMARRSDKPIAAGQITSRTVGAAAVLAAVACVPLSLLAGTVAGAVHLAAVGIAWLYNVWLKRTIASPLPYTLAFGALPAVVTLGLPGTPLPRWWAMLAAALLGTGAHLINTVGDIDDDVIAGVRGLPQRLGPRASVIAAGVLLGAAVTVAAVGSTDGFGRGTVAILAAIFTIDAAAVALAWQRRTQVAWSLTLCLAVLTVVMLIASGTSLVA